MKISNALHALKTREWKTRDRKTRDQIAWVEKAGLENAGPNRMGRNRGTGKRGTKFSRVEKAGPPSMELETDKYRCTVYN